MQQVTENQGFEKENENNPKINFHKIVLLFSGYLYSYPFLSENTSIHTDNNYVRPLYKQILNIEHPTMAFVGIPYGGPHNMMAEIQVNITFISEYQRNK